MKRPLVLFVLLLLSLVPAFSVPQLLEEGRNAEASENYQRAIELYRQAMADSPTDAAPARALAELFTAKSLHTLALPVWQEVLRRAPGDLTAWLSLAQTLSYLDDNAESVRTLDSAHGLFPQSPEVTQALAWMLFKTEDFQRGIKLVEDFLAAHGPDHSLEMTLGTLYSSVLDYGLSRVHYLKSIELAPGSGAEEKNFRSIAWYNLSLLEKGFYQFERADEAIRRSIEQEERPAGLLAWGELYQGRRDFAEARRLYEKAIQADETPLGRFDLARLLQQFGYLDEAEAQLSLVENHKDDTWIYNYGVTKDKVRRDLHELRADLHRSRYLLLDFAPRSNLWEWAVWCWNKASEGLAWWYHDQSWKGLLVKLSESSLAARNSPEAWVGLTMAHRDRPSLGLKYLALIREHEVPKNPRAQASYLVEEGVLRRDAGLLRWALKQLQTPWENEDGERVLAALAEVEKGQPEESGLLSRLYQMNPGGLAVRGWALPVKLGVFGGEADAWKQAWDAYAGQTGWDARTNDRPGVDWTLDWRAEKGLSAWTLRDPEGNTVRSGSVRGDGDKLTRLAEVYRLIHSPR